MPRCEARCRAVPCCRRGAGRCRAAPHDVEAELRNFAAAAAAAESRGAAAAGRAAAHASVAVAVCGPEELVLATSAAAQAISGSVWPGAGDGAGDGVAGPPVTVYVDVHRETFVM